MATAISFDSTDTPPLPIHPFTVEQYHQLGELGVLTPEDRVELLEGWIVKKMNQRPAHGFVARVLSAWLQSNMSAGWLAQCQLPITTDRSEPEPDLAVVHGVHADFRGRHPSGKECALVIEVADSLVLKDRAKASIYAAGGVAEYWIVNLAENQLEKFAEAEGGVYRQTVIFKADETIAAQIGDQAISLPLREILVS